MFWKYNINEQDFIIYLKILIIPAILNSCLEFEIPFVLVFIIIYWVDRKTKVVLIWKKWVDDGYGQALAALLLYSQTKCLSKIEIEKGWFLWNKRGIQYLERWQDSGEQGGWWPTFLKILLFNQSFLRLSNVVRTDDSQWSRIIYEIAVNFMTYSKR